MALGVHDTRRVMEDLFNATQAPGLRLQSLRITQFGVRFGEQQLRGILHAIQHIRLSGFLSLRILGFDISPDNFVRFKALLNEAFPDCV